VGADVTLEQAVATWGSQLSMAARQALMIDWTDSTRACVLSPTPVRSFTDLFEGKPVAWSDVATECVLDPSVTIGDLVMRSSEAYRERGQHGLSLILGWVRLPDETTDLPLVSVALKATRRGKKVENWDLELVGGPSTCAATLAALADDWAIVADIATDDLNGCIASIEQLAHQPGLPAAVGIEARVGLAIQLSGWLDVARDLETFDALAESTLVSALAGVRAARSELRDSVSDLRGTGRRVTVLPSDSSQLDVITRACAGQTLIVEGPPGTGKSQTIANLLAALAGMGKRVLFVAEKRAAVEVVARRLGDANLSHLALDVHDDSADLKVGEPIDARPIATTLTIQDPLTVPEFPLSRAHNIAIQEVLPRAGFMLGRDLSAIPHVSLAQGRQLLEGPEAVAFAVDEVAAANEQLKRRSITTSIANLLRLAPFKDELLTAAQGTDQFDTGSLPFGIALASAQNMVRLAQLGAELNPDQPVPDPQTEVTDALVRKLYGGRYQDQGVRRSVVSNFLSIVRDLTRSGLFAPPAKIGELIGRSRSGSWLQLTAINPELIAALSDVDVRGHRLTDVPTPEAGSAFEALATAVSGIDATAATQIRELNSLGLLEHLLADTDRIGLVRAIGAMPLIEAASLRSVAELEREARSAAAQLEERRLTAQLVVSANARRFAVARMENAAFENQQFEYQGLLRRGRTKRLTAAQVLRVAIEPVLAATPVLIASPWSAARCLPQTAEMFDVVVFDEASQIETATAVPALARSAQAIIFGDSLQLPPNRFFQAAKSETADPVLAQDSLLDAFAILLTGTDSTIPLRWHYRSIDDRLIDFVNNSPLLYNGRLIVSPSPPTETSPIVLQRFENDPISSIRAILAEVTPGQTVAVVTLGRDLATRIEHALALPIAEDEDEPLVVRNIERFQGDERDVIILVLPIAGHGSSAVQVLGPLNQPGGERRLNVALTRARARLVVLSSFGHSDLAAAIAPGAMLLRSFLRSLEEDTRGIPRPSEPSVSDRVITSIAQIIRSRGIAVDVFPERSAAAVRLVVTRPDGASIAVDVETPSIAAMDPLDREILRPAELERRGWIRIRTTIKDWIDEPDAVIEQIRSAMDAGASHAR
jgi:hypothetical protein